MKNFIWAGVLAVFLVGCSGQPETVSWPPATGVNDELAARIPEDAQLIGGIAEDDPLSQEGMSVLGADGNFWPQKGEMRITGGSMRTQVGEFEKRAKFTDWDFVYKDKNQTEKLAWGATLTSGDLLLPVEFLTQAPEGIYAENRFEVQDFGDKFVLVHLDPAKGHRVCVLSGGSNMYPTIGAVGSVAELDGVAVTRREDGWYQGSRKVSE
ncbi:MAG: hypothetical protein JW937_09415 [Candidatus Omnitrophica bacterium]|nr:hypothetical protein [Candidatus Omnitrophota bacterium]